MLEKYISKEAVAKMSYSEFKETFEGNVLISRSGLTIREAFKELGGTHSKKKKADNEESPN